MGYVVAALLGLVVALLTGAIELPWLQRYQLAGEAPIVVRLDTRTGELRVYAVAPQEETKRGIEMTGPITITEVARKAPDAAR